MTTAVSRKSVNWPDRYPIDRGIVDVRGEKNRSRIGGFVFSGEKVSGGLGTVYSGTYDGFPGETVLKVPNNYILKTDAGLQACEIERARLLRLEGIAGIPRVIEFGNIVGYDKFDFAVPYFVMERMDGQTLTELIKIGPHTYEETVKVAFGISRILALAYARGEVHGDIKPDNVLVQVPDGFDQKLPIVSVVDWALGMGTLGYCPPRRSAPSSRNDCYSVAATMFAMMSDFSYSDVFFSSSRLGFFLDSITRGEDKKHGDPIQKALMLDCPDAGVMRDRLAIYPDLVSYGAYT